MKSKTILLTLSLVLTSLTISTIIKSQSCSGSSCPIDSCEIKNGQTIVRSLPCTDAGGYCALGCCKHYYNFTLSIPKKVTVVAKSNMTINLFVAWNATYCPYHTRLGDSSNALAKDQCSAIGPSTTQNCVNGSIQNPPLPPGNYYFAVYRRQDSNPNPIDYNVTLTFNDVTTPSIDFISPTNPNGTSISSFSYVNVSIIDESVNISSTIDFNRSLRGYWMFNESNTAINSTDYSTYNNKGYLGSGPNKTISTNGARGAAWGFNGSSYIEINDSSSLDITDNITIEAWVMSTDWTLPLTTHDVVRKDQAYLLNISSNGNVGFGLYNTQWYNLVSSSTLPTNGLHHIAGVRNGSLMKIYIDGKPDSNTRNDFTGAINSNQNNVTIGRFSSSSQTETFNGTIDEVKIFSRALGDDEINASYNTSFIKLTGYYFLRNLYHNFTNLQEDSYQYYAFAVDQDQNYNKTETRFLYKSCNRGSDCQSTLCVAGTCRPNCQGYNKLQCSDGSNLYTSGGICLNSTQAWQCVNIPSYCDFAIINLTDTFISSMSNTYHCLNQSFSISGKNATQFAPGVQNSVLDCLGYTLTGNDVFNTYGFYMEGSNSYNNIIKNCSINDFGSGIYLYNGPYNNTFVNNKIKSSVYGIMFSSSTNNTVMNGSVSVNTYSDYYLNAAGKTNNFENTNFTSARNISFYDTTSWFNYNNRTDIELWLGTSISPAGNISRKVISWTQSLMRWNDTNNTVGVTTTYNITQLKPNTTYFVYNNTVLTYDDLRTDTFGNLPVFSIYLGSEHNITVQEVKIWLDVNLTEPSPIIWTASNPKILYKYDTFTVNANITCRTNPPGLAGGCGSISGGVRYNDSQTTMTLVPTTPTTPMWTSGQTCTDQYFYNYWNFSTNSSGIIYDTGIAHNATHFFITNGSNYQNVGNIIYAYKRSDQSWVSSWSITARPDQFSLEGIYCNGTHIGVVNRQSSVANSKNVTFYDMDGNYITSFNLYSQIGSAIPTSLVFNDTHVWVSTSGANKRVYRYHSDGTYDNWNFDYQTAVTTWCGSCGTTLIGDGLEFNGTNFFILDYMSAGSHIYAYDLAGIHNGWNITIPEENNGWGLDLDSIDKSFYFVGYTDGWVYRYERNCSGAGAGNPVSLGSLTDGQSNQVTFQVNVTSKGYYKIDVNFTSDMSYVQNDTADAYIRVKDMSDEYLIVNSTEIKPIDLQPGDVNPLSGANLSMNVTVNITNSTYMHPTNNCTIRIFNESQSYSNPVFGPFPGIIKKIDTQWQCFGNWSMDYWRNPGDWNVSVDLSLWMDLTNFTSKNFTYLVLRSWNTNISIINWSSIPGRYNYSFNAYPGSINNTGNIGLNITVNGSDFVGQTYSYPYYNIYVGNVSFANTTPPSVLTGTWYNLKYNYQFIFKINPANTSYVHFRMFVPAGFIPQYYNSNISIESS